MTEYESIWKVFSLDEYRIENNKGKYPQGNNEHRQVNKVAIPKYERDVKACKARLIFLDNTHLRWTPDWQTAVTKCINQGYHLLAITPPLSEYHFITNRSEHFDDMEIFFSMAHLWFGHRFRQFLYKMISPQALPNLEPLRGDSYKKANNYKWGDGWLYVYDDYLGYIDRKMVLESIHGSHLMSQRGFDDIIFAKEGIPHITLIPPVHRPDTSVKLKKVVEYIIKNFEPPVTEYTGVGTVESGNKRTFYLSISQESQNKLGSIVQKAIENVDSSLIPTKLGFHVTLGYFNGDVFDVDKSGLPKYPFEGMQDVEDETIFMPTLRNSVAENSLKRRLSEYENTNGQVLQVLKDNGLISKTTTLKTRSQSIRTLNFLLDHSLVKSKLRMSPEIDTGDERVQYIIIGLAVNPKKKFSSDDQVYIKYPDLQALLPRGLTFCFAYSNNNDTLESTEVMPDTKLSEIATGEYDLIVTEKANGEMFSVSVFKDRGLYVLTMGSKNNKFVFPLDFNSSNLQGSIEGLLKYYMELEGLNSTYPPDYISDPEFAMSNVWLEMSDFFLQKLVSNPCAHEFCGRLADEKSTASSEFESWLHPHILYFPKGHVDFKFFAITSYEPDGRPTEYSGLDRLKQLDWLSKLGFNVVKSYKPETKTLMELRNWVWHRRDQEGFVVLVIEDNSIKAMLKMKTIWYVVHRGLRERMRSYISGQANTKKMNEKFLALKFTEKVIEKLRIFRLENDEGLKKYWENFALELARKVASDLKSIMEENNQRQYVLSYPEMIRTIEEKIGVPPSPLLKQIQVIDDIENLSL